MTALKHTNGIQWHKEGIRTFSAEDIFALPSASLAESAPIPVDANTADNINISILWDGNKPGMPCKSKRSCQMWKWICIQILYQISQKKKRKTSIKGIQDKLMIQVKISPSHLAGIQVDWKVITWNR